ncbi:hypothetical protein [Streptomyces sp. NPDC017941]|uniref:hypothetical protein n=1 Tax=Streptomyces sp. NPDC017941 TaxID=3365018 RepID=UPI0037AB2831
MAERVRALVALSVLYVLVRVPQLGALLVAAGLAGLAGREGPPVTSGLLAALIAALGVMAVGLALALPYLPDRRPGPPSP